MDNAILFLQILTKHFRNNFLDVNKYHIQLSPINFRKILLDFSKM
jgi:hypothetical protein